MPDSLIAGLRREPDQWLYSERQAIAARFDNAVHLLFQLRISLVRRLRILLLSPIS